MKLPVKIDTLLSPDKIKERLLRNRRVSSLFKIGEIKTKIIKQYVDWRSYSFVIVYSLNEKDRVVGVANSDGKKEYPYRVNEFLFSFVKGFVPRPLLYIRPLGLFLMEHVTGKNYGNLLKKGGSKEIYLKQIVQFLLFLRRIKASEIKKEKRKRIKPAIDFKDVKKNIIILKKRGNKGAGKIEKRFREIERKIRKYEKESEDKIFVHGDFNPYNFIFLKKGVKIVDFERSHWGDHLVDIADLCSHFENTPDYSLTKKQRLDLERKFLKLYQAMSLRFNQRERGRFKVYKQYFNLLIKTHIMVWG